MDFTWEFAADGTLHKLARPAPCLRSVKTHKDKVKPAGSLLLLFLNKHRQTHNETMKAMYKKQARIAKKTQCMGTKTPKLMQTGHEHAVCSQLNIDSIFTVL